MRYRWDNVLTCRTFSKAYGLAGIRIGYAMAHSEIIGNIQKVKLPFEPSTPGASQARKCTVRGGNALPCSSSCR